jgi:transposase InsO family protein
MNEEQKKEVALFRYGLIHPLVQDNVSSNERTAIRRQILQSEHKIPHSNLTRIDERTLRKYCQWYREGAFEGLIPGYRSDKGQVKAVTQENLLKALQCKKEVPERSVRQVIQIMELEGVVKSGDIKHSTLARLIKKYADMYESQLVKEQKVFKRYTMERVNQTWQSDVKYSVYIKDPDNPERRLRTYLIAFIDDRSRHIVHAQFYLTENLAALEDCFKKALLKCGVPERVYMDNGKIFTSNRMNLICAELGSKAIYCAPYSPEGKGKIEKFFWYVDKSFEPEVKVSGIETLEQLNEAFSAWLSHSYHNKVHSEIEKTPNEAFIEGKIYIKAIDSKTLYDIFLYREDRKVSKTAVISVCGNLYEVEGKLARKKIQARFHPGDLTKIGVYYQGDRYPDAAPFELSYRTVAEYDAGTKLPVVADNPVEGQMSLLNLLMKKQEEELKKKENRISFTKLFEKEGVSNV